MKKYLFTIGLFFAIVTVSIAATNFETLTVTKKTLTVNAFCKLIQMGDYDAVKSLVDGGINVNQKSTGLTPLMFAARHNRAKIAQLLIDNGAKLKTKSDRGITALKYAELSNAKQSFKVIKEALVVKKNEKKRRRVA